MVSSSGLSLEKSQSKPIKRLGALLEQRSVRIALLRHAEEKKRFFYEMADKAYLKEVGDAPGELAEINKQIGELVSRHHFWIARLFSKTLEFKDSVVKIREQPPEVVAPKNETNAARRLFRLFGETYVTFTPKLNRRAILAAPEEDLARMKPIGIKVRSHLAVQVQSPGESGAKTVFKRPLQK